MKKQKRSQAFIQPMVDWCLEKRGRKAALARAFAKLTGGNPVNTRIMLDRWLHWDEDKRPEIALEAALL